METWVGLIQSYGYLQEKQERQRQKITEAEVRRAGQTAAQLALTEEGRGNLGKLEKPVRQHSPPKFLDVLRPPSTWIRGLWSPEVEAVTFPVTSC